MACMHWHNWSGLIACEPLRQVRAASERDIAGAIAAAAECNMPIRPRGTGHSCSPICSTDGVLISFDGLQGVVDIDRQARRVRVLAGTPISAIGEPLCQVGLALENQGDIDVQTIAGAISTGTHGTGLRFGSMSSKVVGMSIALANGEVVSLTHQADSRLLDAAAVSFGTLGVILDVTLALVERYRLRETNRVLDVEQCFAEMPVLQQRHRNVEFYWLPGPDRCVMKTFDEVNAPLTPVSRMHPEPAPPGTIERYLCPDRVHWSHRIYPSRRTTLFNEMEFAVPLERGLECFSELRAMMQAKFKEVAWAVEYRLVAQDGAYLSQSYERPSACISVHEDAMRECVGFFKAAQAVFLNYGGRPHWGKTHFCSARQLAPLYPRWDEFLSVQKELDPRGVFLNAHLRRVLGL